MLLNMTLDYVDKVINNEIKASKEVKQQCEIFLRDYNNCINDIDEKYMFTETDIKIIEGILSMIRFPKGVFANQIVLEHLTGYQALLIVALFGFRYRSNKRRRKIQTMLLWIPRKNAKTFTIALIMMLLLILEEPYSTLYSVSLNSDLSGITKEMIEQLINNSDISQHFDKNYGKIICKSTHNAMKNLISDADKINSYDSSITVCDEIGAYEDTSLVDAIRSGALGSLNRTLFMTSTSYETDSEVFKNEIDYLRSVLEGEIEDENIFGLLYYADPENWDDIDEMKKANPIVENNPSHLEYLIKECERVKQNNDGLNGFKCKNLNIWLPKDSAEAYLTHEDIRPCIIDDYDFTGKEIIIGLDLANSIDNSALSIVAYDEETGKHITKSVAFIPSDRCYEKERTEKVPYYAYAEKKWCYLTGSRVIDFNFIENMIDELNEVCTVKAIALDRAYAQNIIQNLEDKGYQIVEISQGFIGMNNATRWFREMIYNEEVEIVKNNLFVINLKNAKLVRNTTEQLMVSKKHSTGKVDMTVATLNCFAYIREFEAFERNAKITNLWEE